MSLIYQTQATAIGGRVGSAATADGALRVRLRTPLALGGNGETGTDPEQLFAAGYAACFLSAIRFVARRAQVTIAPDANVTASVGLARRETGTGFDLDVAIEVDLPGLAPATADRIVRDAKAACPYSAALRGNVDIRLRVA